MLDAIYFMNFKKWLHNEIAFHPSADPGIRQIILNRLDRIISLANERRGDDLKDLAGPRHSMDEVHQDAFETAVHMKAVLQQNDLQIAWPTIDELYKRYRHIVDQKSRQGSDLHTGWEDYRKFSNKVTGWLFSIWEMVEDAVKGRTPNEENYPDLK